MHTFDIPENIVIIETDITLHTKQDMLCISKLCKWVIIAKYTKAG